MDTIQFERENRLSPNNGTSYKTEYNEEAELVFGATFLSKFFSDFGGLMIDDGLFRFHTPASSVFWTRISVNYFPKYKMDIHCFGCDWMGRQFGCDIGGQNLIVMFDPATGEAYELNQPLSVFLNEDLVDHKSETLAPALFNELIGVHKHNLSFDKCCGFKKFLFLGGTDELSNYEVIDMEIYWELNHQIYSAIKNVSEQ